MKAHWPWLLLLLVPVALFPGAIPGPAVVSADDHLSVHHAFQSKAGGHVRHPHLSDPALQFKALRKAVMDALQQGEVPLWNSSIWTGAPLLGDAQSMVGSPVTWIHFLLPSHLAADVSVAWLLIWVGLGCGLLARELGAHTWGAVTAGAAGMTAPYISVWLLHPHSATAVWLPWVLWAMEKRHPPLLALCTAGLLMGGHPETAAHVGVLVCAWWALRLRSFSPLLGLCSGALLAAPIYMPFVEEALRSATLSAHGGNTLAPSQLLDLLWPNWHGHPATETWSRRDWSWANGRIHPGLGALVFAAMAVVQKNRTARLLVGLFAVAITLSITGLPGPLNHARLASMSAILVGVASGLSVRERWGPAAFLVVLGTGVWGSWHDQGSVSEHIHNPDAAPWTDKLKEHVGEGRIVGLGWALQPNTGALLGLDDLRGYDLPVSIDTERLQTALNPRPIRPWFQLNDIPPINLLRWAGVRAVLSTEPSAENIDLGEAPLYASAVNEAMGPAWKATAPKTVQDPNQSVRSLLHATPDNPPVERLHGTWPQNGHVQPATSFKRTSRSVSFSVNGPSKGLAVVADAWHPGWTVTVNGQKAEPLRVGGVFRGVVVPEGAQDVRWYFAPWGWKLGCGLFWLGLGLLAFSTRKKQRR